jgi:hypothetical protein
MNEFIVVCSNVKSWFSKVFKSAPKDTAAVLAVVNCAAPLFEVAIAVIDPALAPVADPIITEIQADLGTVAAMLKAGNITSIGTFLTAIKSNMATLLTEGHITDTASVAKANAFLGVINSVSSELGV